jgi:histidyl-tRNA synthetase
VLDAEVVLLGWEALRRAGLPARMLTLRLNTLGDPEDRPAYHEALNAYLDTIGDLPADVEARRHANPLRAFDSKAPGMSEVMAEAPLLADHLSEAAKAHHARVVELLEAEGVPLTHDPRLVRGLDYYTRTTFEYQAAGLGAQNAVGGGGRYDGLAQVLGWGERFPGIGWALGVERTMLALRGADALPPPRPRVAVFVVVAAPELAGEALSLVSALRRAGVAADLGFDRRSVKAQFKVADRAGAARVVVLGPDEVARGVLTVKDLATGEQREIARTDATRELTGP